MNVYHDVTFVNRSGDSAVGTATGYGLDDRGVGVSSPGRVKNFFHSVQTGFEVLSNGYRGLFPRVKQPGRETDHSPPASADVKKTWVYTSTPPYVVMV
jgi:hypothetical protein